MPHEPHERRIRQAVGWVKVENLEIIFGAVKHPVDRWIEYGRVRCQDSRRRQNVKKNDAHGQRAAEAHHLPGRTYAKIGQPIVIFTRPDRAQLQPFASKQAFRTTVLDLGGLFRPLEDSPKPPGYLGNSFLVPLITLKHRPASAVKTPSSVAKSHDNSYEPTN